MNAHDPLAWLAPYLPQRRDTVEEPLQWADAGDENARQRAMEDLADEHIARHDPQWLEWLLNYQTDSIAGYISLSMACCGDSDAAIEAARLRGNLHDGYRRDYAEHLSATED